MTAILWLLGLGAVLGVCWLIGVIEERRAEWHLPPHLYSCIECHTGYSDARAFAWHRQAAHVETYDSDRAPNAVHRRSDAGRNSAGEILDGSPAGSAGSPAGLMKQRTRDRLSSTEESP